ncbi:TPA: hypothetical protein ACV750_004614, partial [Escherichia coli]
ENRDGDESPRQLVAEVQSIWHPFVECLSSNPGQAERGDMCEWEIITIGNVLFFLSFFGAVYINF